MAVMQRKRFRDTLESSLKAFEIGYATWEHAALDRPSWCIHVIRGAVPAEERRTVAARRARAFNAKEELQSSPRQQLPSSAPPVTGTFMLGLDFSVMSGHKNNKHDASGLHRSRWRHVIINNNIII